MLFEKSLSIMAERQIQVRIFMTNGFQMKGVIESADETLVVLTTAEGQRFLNPHAISTIATDKGVALYEGDLQ